MNRNVYLKRSDKVDASGLYVGSKRRYAIRTELQRGEVEICEVFRVRHTHHYASARNVYHRLPHLALDTETAFNLLHSRNSPSIVLIA